MDLHITVSVLKHLFSETNWLIWTSFFLFLITTSQLNFYPKTTILITGFVTAFSIYLLAFIPFCKPLFIILFFMLTYVCVYSRQFYPQYFLASFISVVLIILSFNLSHASHASHASQANINNANRFILMSISIIIVLLLQTIFFSCSIKKRLEQNKKIVIKKLEKLNKEIFSCLLQQEYRDNIYLYERRLHIQKTNYLQALKRFRSVIELAKIKMNQSDIHFYKKWEVNLDLLFTTMMDYSQLRRRVTDYTTLSVCSQELTKIEAAINYLLNEMINNSSAIKIESNINKLNQKINNLEDNYHHVLQVASREPLAFLLFIDSLRRFRDQIQTMNEIKKMNETAIEAIHNVN